MYKIHLTSTASHMTIAEPLMSFHYIQLYNVKSPGSNITVINYWLMQSHSSLLFTMVEETLNLIFSPVQMCCLYFILIWKEI